jgi:hypothetical protein
MKGPRKDQARGEKVGTGKQQAEAVSSECEPDKQV